MASCPVWSAANTVVEADDVVGNVTRGLGMVGVIALSDALHLQVQEEALHDGLSHQFALRLMLPTIPCFARRAQCEPQAY